MRRNQILSPEPHGWHVTGTGGFLSSNPKEGTVAAKGDWLQEELESSHITVMPNHTYPQNVKTNGVGKKRTTV